jgi:hypothetical protein
MIRQPHALIGNLAAAVVALLAGTNVVHAEGDHSFTIKNNSGNTINITSVHGYCVTSIDAPQSIASGGTATVNWVDSNNIKEIVWMAAHGPHSARTRTAPPRSEGIDGVGCTNTQKWVIFKISNYGGSYGIVHRKISGDWYNGQFWAVSAEITSDGGWTWQDSNQVPDSRVSASCSHTGCFGKFGEMVNNGKDSYNWPRIYKTEDGYQFQFN